MADKGHIIAGSDRTFDRQPFHPLKKILEAKGITIAAQDGSGVDSAFDFAVFSTAVEPGRPEFIKVRELGIPLKTRPEYLAEITASFKTIAVSGTSGKSSVAGLLAFLMKRLGLNPNFIGGGRVKQFKSSSNPGNFLAGSSDYLVIEACESDGSVVNYRPQYSVILNLALDHHTVDKTAHMFEALIHNTAQQVIMNADDENLEKIAGRDITTFSLLNPSDYRADAVEFRDYGTDFSLRGTRFRLLQPGAHNVYNALSCITLLVEMGIPPARVADMLPEFQGIERRFDIILNDKKGLVIDDYAHNPHKISCLMETVKKLRQQVCYIFQPHGFGPTRLMRKEYIQTFISNLRDSDHLILLPIYYAGGTAGKDISSHDLAYEIKSRGKSVEVVEERNDILQMPDKYRCYIIFGARDETLSDFAREIAGRLAGIK